MEGLQNFIDGQHKAVVHLALALGGQPGAPHVGEAAVHIPLDVGDGGAFQHGAQVVQHILLHFGASEVQHQLIPAPGEGTAGHLEGPVGMGAVEVGVFVHHLRLHPDAELHAQVLDALGQGGQAAGKLLLIDVPVAQSAEVVVPLPEPAVVHHHHLHAHLAGGLGNGVNLVRVKVEEGGLPVVDEDGPALVLPGAPAQVEADGPVEHAAHVPQAPGGEDHGRLRGSKGLTGLEQPGEVEGVDAQGHAGLVELGVLGGGQEVARVHQGHAPAAAGILGGILVTEDEEGVLLVAGGAPHAARGVNALGEGGPYRLTLPGIGTPQGDEVVLPHREVQAGGGHPGEPNRGGSVVAHPDGPGDEVIFLQYAVEKLHHKAAAAVPELHRETLGGDPLAVEGGQTLQGVLALLDGVADVAEIRGVAAVFQFCLQGGGAEVPNAAGGVLLGLGVQRPGAVPAHLVGVGREAPVLRADEPGEVAAPEARTVVGVQQHPGGVELHLVAGAAGTQRNGALRRIILNHGRIILPA